MEFEKFGVTINNLKLFLIHCNAIVHEWSDLETSNAIYLKGPHPSHSP